MKKIITSAVAALAFVACSGAGGGQGGGFGGGFGGGGGDFEPIKVDPNSAPISFARKVPHYCAPRGYREGKDSVLGRSNATLTLLRDSAKNDLQNEANHVLRQGKRGLIIITKEESFCSVKGKEIKCNATNNDISSYRITGDVYECEW